MQTCHNWPNVLFEQFRIYNATYFKRKYRLAVKCSLRSKRFRRAFRRFEAFFAFWTRENWGKRKKVRKGGGEGRKGNARPQTPWFWKTCSSMNGVFWLAQHGSDKSISQIKYVHLSVTRMNTTNWLLSLSCLVWLSHTNRLSLFLPDVLFQLVNHRCSGLTQEFHFCPDPAADLKDFRQRGIYTNILQTRAVAWWSLEQTLEQPFTQVDRLLWQSLGNSRLATYRIPNNFE